MGELSVRKSTGCWAQSWLMLALLLGVVGWSAPVSADDAPPPPPLPAPLEKMLLPLKEQFTGLRPLSRADVRPLELPRER